MTGPLTNGLTSRQREALDFVRAHQCANGYPPTWRQIGDHMGIRSTNGVHDHLIALQRKGAIRLTGAKYARRITLLDGERPAVERWRALPADDAARLLDALRGAAAGRREESPEHADRLCLAADVLDELRGGA